METKLLEEQSGGRKVVVHAILIQSESIKVKSQVPIQALLEEEGIEPERSPWNASPFRHNFSLLQQRPCYWPDTDTLMKDPISAPLATRSHRHSLQFFPLLSHQG